MIRARAVLAVVVALAACGRDPQPTEPARVDERPATPAPAAPAPLPAPAPAGSPGAAPTQPAPPPPAGALSEAEVAAIGERMLGVMERVATAAEGAGADCGAMAAAIEQVARDSQATLDELRAAADASDASDALFDVWMQKNNARAATLADRLAPALDRCATDPRLQAAIGRLGA